MDGKSLRIIYMGTPDFAVAPLKNLVEKGYNIVAVVTSPDKPAGRGLKVQESAVKKYAVSAGLPVLQPGKLRDEAFVEQFRSLNADLAIVIAFRMLPEIIWAQPRLGTFNLHASLLPQYRGAAPINWAIINGEKQTGVTTFMLNHEIDKGAIIGRRTVDITPDDNAGTLHDKLMHLGTGLVEESIEMIANGTVSPQSQETITSPDTELKGAPKIFKETCRIDWAEDCRTINDLIRGLSPYPTAWGDLSGNGGSTPLGVKIYAVHPETITGTLPAPGTISSDDKTHIKVACSDGWIYIDRLQIAGKKQMSTEEFLRGFKNIGNYSFV